MRTSLTTTHLTGKLNFGSHKLNIPSLSLKVGGPSRVPSRLAFGGPGKPGTNIGNPFKPGGNLTVNRNTPGKTATPGKTGPGSGSLTISGRLNMTCGTCHNCKGNAPSNPGQIANLQPVPPRSPALPVFVPVVAPRPQLTIQPPSLVFRPFAPPLLAPAPINIQTGIYTPALPFIPTTLTMNPSLITTLSAPPKLTASLGKALVAPPPEQTTSMMTSSLMQPTPHVAAPIQLVAADLPPPSLSPAPAPASGTKLGLPNPVELMVATEPAKTAAPPPVAAARKPSLVASLLQPPLLPSGGVVSPGDIARPVLDEPPVLPVLADTLIQPPPLRPLPGT
jgi:hypothetical protein